MTHKTETPTLAATSVGAESCSSGWLNALEYTSAAPEIHQVLQSRRLRHRFGLPRRRADLVASLAFGGQAQ